jgi:hypothetical protein
MSTTSLARRLKRLEDRLIPAVEEPFVFTINTVDERGRIVGRFRLTPTGLQSLTPDEDHPKPDTTRTEDESHRQAPVPA